MKKGIALGALFAGATLASCVSVQSGNPPFTVSAGIDGETCWIVTSGKRVTPDQLAVIAHAHWKDRAVIVASKEMPFRCVGGAVVALQHAGLARIDLARWDDGVTK